MAVSAHVYAPAGQSLGTKLINLSSDTLKVMLCTSGYTPNQAGHRFKSDITNEVSGTGYTAGGAALTTVTFSQSGNTATLTCDSVTWQNSSITARYAVFYDDTPAGDGSKPLLCYWDFGADTTSSAAPFTLTMPSSGLLQLAVS